MSLDPNIPRWIFASASKTFGDLAESFSIPLYVEGDDRFTEDVLEYFEFRSNGPYFREESKDWWCINYDVNIFCGAKRRQDSFHRIHQLVGYAMSFFTTNLTIHKYGTADSDDQSILTCLTLKTTAGENVRINHFGQAGGPDLLEMQATVEGFYYGYLDTGPANQNSPQ